MPDHIAPHLLAKSIENGGTTLFNHTCHVVAAIEKSAECLQFNTRIARIGAVLHDLGKAHDNFQKKLKKGYKPKDNEIAHRHEISSILFLPIFPKEDWADLVDLIIAHHKSIKKDKSQRGFLDLVEKATPDPIFENHYKGFETWSKDCYKIIEWFGYETKKITKDEAYKAFKFALEHCENKGCNWSELRGLLMGADHFASALAEETNVNLEKLYKKPDLSGFERKGELYPLSNMPANDPRRHTLVTAPTGAGKTDYLMRRCDGRVFYMLPFQASINAMFERFKETIPNCDIRIQHAASKMKVNDENEKQLQNLMGSSVKVLTPYQVAAVVFGTPGYEAIAIDVRGCSVILDEIHCYTKIARTIVLELIRVLLMLNCRIHIGTATMPSILFNKIYELLGGEEKVYTVSLSQNELSGFNRHIVHKIEKEQSDIEKIKEIIKARIEKKEKILIVVNRVKKSQEIFCSLSEYDVPKMLIHSRFKREDRNELESKLKNNYNKMQGGCIVVSTQVVEVSLDISFDVMITDCAPLDSLVQRFGRINRVRNKETIGKYKDVFVLAPPENETDAPPYDIDILKRSYAALPNGELLYENSLQQKIDSVYTELDFKPIDTETAYTVKGEEVVWGTKELANKDKAFMLDAMEIESASCIIQSDKEKYQKANSEERKNFEIQISYKARHYLPSKEQLECGSFPLVVLDESYSSELGLIEKPTGNFINII